MADADCLCDTLGAECNLHPPGGIDPGAPCNAELSDVYLIEGVLRGARVPSSNPIGRVVMGNYGLAMAPSLWDPSRSRNDIAVPDRGNPDISDGMLTLRCQNPSACYPMTVQYFIQSGVFQCRYRANRDHYHGGWHFLLLGNADEVLVENRVKGVGALSKAKGDTYRLEGQTNMQFLVIPPKERRTLRLQPHVSRDSDTPKSTADFLWTSMELSAQGWVMPIEEGLST